MEEAAIGDDDEEDDNAPSALNDSLVASSTTADLTSLPRKTKDGYVCPVCQKAYKSRQGLKIHVDGRHRGITQDCPHCGKEFRNPSSLYQHVKRVHEGANIKKKNDAEESAEQGESGYVLFYRQPGCSCHQLGGLFLCHCTI